MVVSSLETGSNSLKINDNFKELVKKMICNILRKYICCDITILKIQYLKKRCLTNCYTSLFGI